MNEKLRIRIKIKNEPDLILFANPNTTISELLTQISEIKNINKNNLKIIHNGNIVNSESVMHEFNFYPVSPTCASRLQ